MLTTCDRPHGTRIRVKIMLAGNVLVQHLAQRVLFCRAPNNTSPQGTACAAPMSTSTHARAKTLARICTVQVEPERGANLEGARLASVMKRGSASPRLSRSHARPMLQEELDHSCMSVPETSANESDCRLSGTIAGRLGKRCAYIGGNKASSKHKVLLIQSMESISECRQAVGLSLESSI